MADLNKLPAPTPGREEDQAPEQPLIAHLLELRDRLMRVVITILVLFMGLFYFANDLYTLLAKPLLAHLPKDSSMIATEVTSPFLTPFKLTLIVSVFLAIPVVLYHLWAFVAPGLYKRERKMVMPLLVSSTLLFFAGAAFAYFVVFPVVFKFMTSVAPEGVAVMTDISKYLDFVLSMFFAFGVAFEVPVAVVLLVWTGAVTPDSLAAKRRYVIVGAFVVGMLLTPPDVLSQILLAVPLWLLFELGIVVARMYAPQDKEEEPDLAGQDLALSPSQRSYGTPPGAQSVNPTSPRDEKGSGG